MYPNAIIVFIVLMLYLHFDWKNYERKQADKERRKRSGQS